MQPDYQIKNTTRTALGIGSSLLVAMLIIEYTIIGNLNNILAYCAISFFIAAVYLITMITNRYLLRRKSLDYRLHDH